jgi:Leucine-rich repeat (LRR) protein
LQRLKELNLNNNEIAELRGEHDFPPNLRSSLKILSLAGNSLTYADLTSFRLLTSLQHLDLSGNNILALNEITLSQGNDFLPSAPLSVTSLPPEETEASPYDNYRPGGGGGRSPSHSSSPSSSFAPQPLLTQLESLNLANNRLTKIPFEAIHNLSALKVLDLSSNLISATSDVIDYKGRKLSLQQLRLDLNR